MLEQSGLVEALKAEGTEEARAGAENWSSSSARRGSRQAAGRGPPPSPNESWRGGVGAAGPSSSRSRWWARPTEKCPRAASADDAATPRRARVRRGVHGGHGGRVFPSRPLDRHRGDRGGHGRERRLCYVGFTARAAGCSCRWRSSDAVRRDQERAPSRFISEVPRELFEFPQEHAGDVATAAKPRSGATRPKTAAVDAATTSRPSSGATPPARACITPASATAWSSRRAAGRNAVITVQFEAACAKTIQAAYLTQI